MWRCLICALVAQSVEHRSYEPKVWGSSPHWSINMEVYIKFFFLFLKNGCGFDSRCGTLKDVEWFLVTILLPVKLFCSVTGHSSVGRAIDCRSIGHLFKSGCPEFDLSRERKFSQVKKITY